MSEFKRSEQPADGDERDILLGWLAFHRDALLAKCEGLTASQLVRRSADPSRLSLLGLVRHMAEMERAYGSWPLGEDPEFRWVWGEYEDGAEDDIDCTVNDADLSYLKWMDERSRTDGALAGCADLGTLSKVNGRSIRWNLAKLVGEYARQWSRRHHPRTDRRPDRRMTRPRWLPSRTAAEAEVFSMHAWRMDRREDGDWAALPGIAPEESAAPAIRLECDGETFELRPDEFGGTHYTWLSGPNPGYGFSTSPTPDEFEQHLTNIRGFLSMIDPRTGYIEED